MTDANEKLVVVTGATGHVGSWIVKDLLDHGYRVRATVRNIKQSRYDFLKQMDKANRLELVEFDLVKDDAKSFASNVLKDDCELVIHTASPYFLSVKDATRDLVNPAVQGSLKVLEACSFPSSKVKRVIVTSSIAAITDSPKRDYVYTELDWNESSGLSRNPYYLSKAMSERKAHEWYRQKNPPFVLIFLNPSLCIGPQLNPGGAINTSNRIFLNCVDGYYPVSFAGAWPFVDVRDVAELHRIVLERTDIPHGRYIVHKQSLWMKEIIDVLRPTFPGLPYPRFSVGNSVLNVLAYTVDPGQRQWVHTHLGTKPIFDNTKLKNSLKYDYTDISKSLKDTTQYFLSKGVLKQNNKSIASKL